jgi:serine/threonine protein phosphatase PrpC
MVGNWQLISTSVIGASHLLKGKPNQDAIRHYQGAGDSLTVMAVADGHGGEKYTHSDFGAKFAVKAAITVLKETFKNQEDFSLSQIKRLSEEDIPKAIVRSWQEKVDEYCQKQPMLNNDNKYRYFGSTLLVTLILPRCIVYWQLGDGDILTVSDNHNVTRPIPPDSRLLGNETTSLCGKKPWLDFRCCFQPITDNQPPRFILLSSDGYSNAYSSNADFQQTVLDIAEFITSEGQAWVREQLPDWLEEASKQGSGDDISVGIMFRQ